DALAFRRELRHVAVAGHATILQRQKIHCEVDAVELSAGNVQIARLLGSGCERDRIELVEESSRGNAVGTVAADMGVRSEFDALGAHRLDAAVDLLLLQLEIGNAVTKHPPDAIAFLEQYNVVSGAPELLSAGHARRARPDHRNALARARTRRLRYDPA